MNPTLQLVSNKGGRVLGSFLVPSVHTKPYPGLDGVLHYISALTSEAASSPKVQKLAARIVGSETDTFRRASLFYRWIGKNIDYVLDPSGVERLQSAEYTLNIDTRQGDCDDMVILGGAFFAIARIPVRLYVIRQRGFADFNHILLQFQYRGKWFNFDPTRYRKGKGYAGEPLPEETIIERRIIPLNVTRGRAKQGPVSQPWRGHARQTPARSGGARPGRSRRFGLAGEANHEPALNVVGAGGIKAWITLAEEDFLNLTVQTAYESGDLLCPDTTVDVTDGSTSYGRTFIRTGRMLFVGCFGNGSVPISSDAPRRIRLDFYRGKMETLTAFDLIFLPFGIAPPKKTNDLIGSVWIDRDNVPISTPSDRDLGVKVAPTTPGGGSTPPWLKWGIAGVVALSAAVVVTNLKEPLTGAVKALSDE